MAVIPTLVVQTGQPDAAATLAAVDARLRQVVDELQASWRASGGTNADILGAADLPALIADASAGGKRIRPEMAHWGWVAAGSDPAALAGVVDVGAAVELLHVMALIHDDVMDRSELRRGHPSVHALARDAHRAAGGHDDAELFGHSIAILAGDLVHSEVLHLLAPLPARVRDLWRHMMIELVLGQRRDLTGAALSRRDLQHSLEVARLKSGSYTVEGPLLMGAALGGADAGLLDVLRTWAGHVGRAFGLRDDLLGMWGDPRDTGKSRDDDLADGKATVLLALASERLSPEGRARLDRAGTEALTTDDLASLREEMDGCGIRAEVEQMIAAEVGAACALLHEAHLPPEALAGLESVARRIGWRNA